MTDYEAQILRLYLQLSEPQRRTLLLSAVLTAQANELEREMRRTAKEQMDAFALALLEFVKRAAGKNAAAEEVKVLPAVAGVLLELFRLGR